MRTNTLEHHWMPFTPNRDFKRNPRIIQSANGMYYRSAEGQKILDGAAGLWCVNAGHSHPTIVQAVQQAITELDYAPSFNFGHPGPFELSTRLARLFPTPLESFFFCNSGSEAVDSALKIALSYHRARGLAGKTRFIGRERAYHGVGFGGMSVGGIVGVRKEFGPLLPGVDHLRHTHDPSRNRFARGEVIYGAELADDLENLVALHGGETIAAVIVEPVAGSIGVLPPPKGYLARLREIATKHDILLIFDEVITAFGRLGKGTASEYFGVTPDLICFAKGLTSGVIPMGGVAVRSDIYAMITEHSCNPIELPHGYTYSGHPVAAAAALGALDAYEQDGMFERSAELHGYFADAAHSLRGSRHVADIRTIGLAAAIELEPRATMPGARAYQVMQTAWAKGLLVRITGDTIALSPPLIINREEVDFMFDRLQACLEEAQ